ncbi:MAG: YigZ family protein [Thermovirgaceae bacterium]|nr:YigZ family protein [Thermovirgaceae bacterium]
MSVRDEYLEPASSAEAELREKRSQFVGRVFRAVDENEARERIREVSKQHPDASHTCWAYRVGFPNTVEYYSDAGEPSGTAGKPILGALLRAKLVNVVVVVTRYFGGTKLGVRGLINAYGYCASLALEKAGTRSRVRSREAFVECPCEHARAVIRQMTKLGIPEDEIRPEWGSSVKLAASVPWSMAESAVALFDGYSERGFISKWEWKT